MINFLGNKKKNNKNPLKSSFKIETDKKCRKVRKNVMTKNTDVL